MKRLIIFLVILISVPIYSQAPSLLWEKAFMFGTGFSNDQPQGIAIDKHNNIFVNGLNQIFSGPIVKAAFMKFSNDGNSEFVFRDSTSAWTTSNFNQITTLENDDIVFSSSYFDGTKTNLIYVDKSNTEIWRKEIQGFPGITSVSDTTIVVTQGNQNIFFYNPNGNIIRSFSLGDVRGNISVKVISQKIVITALYYQGSVLSAFAAQYNRYSGEEIWRVNFPYVARAFGDADQNGNVYIGLSEFQEPLLKFGLIKLNNSNGSEIWRKEWFGRPENGEANMNNWVNTVAVSNTSNQVVLGGVIQRDSANTSRNIAYMKSFNANNGSTLWKKKFLYDTTAIINNLNAIKFDNSGNLITLGNTYTDGYGNPPNIGYLRKYDKLTAIKQTNNSIPSDFVLSQNYPNPFNPSTKIRFSITKLSFVTLKVYDLLGREVATLVNEEKPAGSYEVMFNTFSGENGLTSGVYFYRISAASGTSNFTETKKLVLLK